MNHPIPSGLYCKTTLRRRKERKFELGHWTRGQILSPWLGDLVDCGIGLSHRPARLQRLASRYGTLCQSRLQYIPQSGTKNLTHLHNARSVLFCMEVKEKNVKWPFWTFLRTDVLLKKKTSLIIQQTLATMTPFPLPYSFFYLCDRYRLLNKLGGWSQFRQQ